MSLIDVSYNLNIPVTNQFYVDKNRTDTYTSDGTIYRPYKTIQSAINAAISQAIVEVAFIINPGNYIENLTLNGGATLQRVFFYGNGAVYISPASGLSFDSSTSNTGLDIFIMDGIKFTNSVQLIGSANGANVGGTDLTFKNCTFLTDLTIKNVAGFALDNFHAFGNLTFENIGNGLGILTAGQGINPGGTLNIITNLGNNQPTGFSQTVIICEKILIAVPVNVDSGSSFQVREGVRLGAPGVTVAITGVFTSYNGFIRGNIALPIGSAWTNNGTFYDPALLGSSGTITNKTFGAVIGYSAAVPANWLTSSPILIETAINRLASLLASTGSGGRVGNATLASGAIIVANTAIGASSRVFLSAQNGTLNIGSVWVSARTAGSSFTISSSNTLDNRDVAYWIQDPA